MGLPSLVPTSFKLNCDLWGYRLLYQRALNKANAQNFGLKLNFALILSEKEVVKNDVEKVNWYTYKKGQLKGL